MGSTVFQLLGKNPPNPSSLEITTPLLHLYMDLQDKQLYGNGKTTAASSSDLWSQNITQVLSL
ncbi:MAG: hypothetical protein ACFBSF_06370 [Leptolyngbyaceae cyanobacterium]